MTIKKSKDIILRLRDKFRLKYFIETGTLHGKTAAWAAKHFEQVYSIEISKRHHNRAKRLNPKHNIQFILGNSGRELLKVLKKLDGPALVWLDAHWSPDLKYPRPLKAGECPLLDELRALSADGRPHVILIDDAHLFVKGVEVAHPGVFTPADWPDAKTVYHSLGDRSIEVKNDVIIALPK